MTKRLEILFSLIKKCEVFADVGCDHGYIAEAVLKGGLANKVIISDISSKSLKKAQNLLKDYQGVVKSYNCDGVSDYDGEADLIFIAGMGGEEICKIISNIKFLPKRMVLCPHKNTTLVRKLLVEKGYFLERDFTFLADNKYYDGISCVKGKDNYSYLQLYFGKENLLTFPKDFLSKLRNEESKLVKILSNENLSSTQKEVIENKLALIKKAFCEYSKNI